MALTNSYLVTTRNLETLLNAILSAQAPERFSYKFLKDIGLTSSNDRLFVGLLKGLGFIEESGAPTKRYFDYLDQTKSGKILADAIRESYEDLFQINKEANNLSESDVKNKLKTLTQGQKSENVYNLMAKTFKALCNLADWSKVPKYEEKEGEKIIEKKEIKTNIAFNELGKDKKFPSLHYNIQIILPATRDTAVYDAIFQSLREHLF